MKYLFLQKYQKGNSLIELMVYLGIFSVLCLVIIKSLVTSMTIYSQSQAYRKVQSQGELVMERITRELRQATSVTSGTYNTSPGSVSLSGKDLSSTPETVVFDVSGGNVQVTVNGATPTPLTGGQVGVSSLIFRSVTTSVGTAIKVELILTTTSGYKITTPFYTTVLLRGK
jgi:Tfp pilus assembly protein PilW